MHFVHIDRSQPSPRLKTVVEDEFVRNFLGNTPNRHADPISMHACTADIELGSTVAVAAVAIIMGIVQVVFACIFAFGSGDSPYLMCCHAPMETRPHGTTTPTQRSAPAHETSRSNRCVNCSLQSRAPPVVEISRAKRFVSRVGLRIGAVLLDEVGSQSPWDQVSAPSFFIPKRVGVDTGGGGGVWLDPIENLNFVQLLLLLPMEKLGW